MYKETFWIGDEQWTYVDGVGYVETEWDLSGEYLPYDSSMLDVLYED